MWRYHEKMDYHLGLLVHTRLKIYKRTIASENIFWYVEFLVYYKTIKHTQPGIIKGVN